jgi:hypothetical protein
MTATQQLRFWLVGLIVALIGIYLLRAILLPFVAGAGIAYFLDPACDKLEKWMSRTWAPGDADLRHPDDPRLHADRAAAGRSAEPVSAVAARTLQSRA